MQSTMLVSLPMNEFEALIQSIVQRTFKRMFAEWKAPQSDEFITLEEVARLLKKSKVTLHAWKKKGILPFYRLEGNVYFKRDEVLNAPKVAKIKTAE